MPVIIEITGIKLNLTLYENNAKNNVDSVYSNRNNQLQQKRGTKRSFGIRTIGLHALYRKFRIIC
jgi:hypothetical protein